MLKKLLYFVVATFFTLLSIKAQTFCIDPNRAISNYPCPTPDYVPVCGCDGKTYRNVCEAQMRNGVQFWQSGPCSGFEIDVIPTVIDINNTLRVSFSSNSGITAQFVITDFWGKLVMQRTLPALVNASVPFVFDLPEASLLRTGVYIIFVYDGQGRYRYLKFVKV